MNIIYTVTLALGATFANAHTGLRASQRKLQSSFPSYSQQCRDDAGPPFMDDAEAFGPNGKYHDGKPAFAVGDCPGPLKGACAVKSQKAAFLEGPIDCGGRGWFCRIQEEPGWPANALMSDVNFGYCNTTDGFQDDGYDRSGHCHGSTSDDAFYWWVRDHWFRGYNGRLRCCCGWDDVEAGSIVNGCDYRRLVTQEENLENCRDANEEGVTPYRGGCNLINAPTLNQPIPENDAKCWEVQKFGEPEDSGPNTPVVTENENDEENENENENEEENEIEDEDENEIEDEDENENEDNEDTDDSEAEDENEEDNEGCEDTDESEEENEDCEDADE